MEGVISLYCSILYSKPKKLLTIDLSRELIAVYDIQYIRGAVTMKCRAMCVQSACDDDNVEDSRGLLQGVVLESLSCPWPRAGCDRDCLSGRG